MSNIIFYFSGTGNSLKITEDIASNFQNCQIEPMANFKDYNLEEGYDSIGFVYPTYFGGIPAKVRGFVYNLNLQKNKNAYYFAVATYGGMPGNALSQIKVMLGKKDIKLNFAKALQMPSNYVVLYDIKKDNDERLTKANENLKQITNDIKNKTENEVKNGIKIIDIYYKTIIKTVYSKDKNFNVSNSCTSCEICKNVCPVNNINMKNGKPNFEHHCEQCMACISYCPQKAINYKNKTQKRGRYNHPLISNKELSAKNKIL